MNSYIQKLLNFFYEYYEELLINKIITKINIRQISVDYLSNNKRGDIATNFYLIIKKKIINQDYDFENNLTKKLLKIDFINSFEITNTGFINFFLKDNFILDSLNNIYQKNYEDELKFGNNEKINIEFVSANPTGPIHVAHLRGAIFGDVLSNLYKKTGFSVVREYYVNDAGSQIKKLSNSLYKRYIQVLGKKIEFTSDEYPGEYLIDIAKEIYSTDKNIWLDKEEDEINTYFQKIAVNKILKEIKSNLKLINVNFDIFTHESEIVKSGIINQLFDILKQKNLIYEGILTKPKGDDVHEWEPRKQLLFRSTNINDDQDRAFKKSNGEWTYFANDAAYHFDKYKRNFNKLINVWGSDHIGYIPRMKSIMYAIQDDNDYFQVITCQIVSLIQNKKKIKMSKREGNFITLLDVFNEVGKDPIRYYMISTKNETAIDFDLDEVIKKNKDNKVFYCQYAFARASSVINKAKELNIKIEKINDIEKFITNITEEELKIIKLIISYTYLVYQSCYNNEPYRLVAYLETICSMFHSLWNKGKDNESFRFLDNKNQDQTKVKLFWIECFRIIVKDIFSIIGIEAPEKM